MSHVSVNVHRIKKIEIRDIDGSGDAKWRNIDLLDEDGNTTTICCFAGRDGVEVLPVSFVRGDQS